MTGRRRAPAALAVVVCGAVLAGCAGDYVGASSKARGSAEAVRTVIEEQVSHNGVPSAEGLAENVDTAIIHTGAHGGVIATDVDGAESGTVDFWVDGDVQSTGGVFDRPDAAVRLCVRLVLSASEPVRAESTECAGAALPLARGQRSIGL